MKSKWILGLVLSLAALAPGVAVTATNTATNAQRSTTSNDAGIYSFPSLAPGGYSVRAEKSGFKANTAKIEVQVQRPCVLTSKWLWARFPKWSKFRAQCNC